MGTSKQISQAEAGAQSPEARRALQLLLGMGEGAAGQMGDLSGLAGGDVGGLTAQDQTLVGQVQGAAGDVTRSQMQAGLQDTLRSLEDTTIGRGIAGSSLEAVNNAVVGRDFERQMNEQLMQQGGQAAGMLVNMPFQRAETTLSANRLLLDRLTGGLVPVMNYDAIMRQLNQRTTDTKKDSIGSTLASGLTQLGGSYLSRPAGGGTE